MTESNGTTENGESKEPNKLDQIHAAWVKNGSKEPPQGAGKKAAEAVEAAYLKVDKLEADLEVARAEAHKAAEALALLYGKRSFAFKTLGNVMLTGRGDRIMLRVESHKERVSF